MSKVRDEGGLSKTVTATSALAPPEPEALDDALPVVEGGHYELLGEVARGGIGRIIKARDLRLKREVAIKQLHDGRSGQARFVREAMLTARLQHPSIIPVHEVGRFASDEPFFAMKLVHGQSLREAIRQRPTLDQRLELLPSALAVADAIAYAHSQRVIHRDLKPSNVLIGAFGETVVIDWGLAKDLDADDASDDSSRSEVSPAAADATNTGAVLGTPAYMPPEQALGESVDERADVYALGALLYHVIAGKPPFEGSSAAETLQKVVKSEPAPLSSLVSGLPADLAAIVARAMARAKEQRYPDARALAEDLRRYQLGQIPTVREQETEYDPELERELDAELRRKAVRPARVICLLSLTLIPIFAVVEAISFKSWMTPMVAIRGAAMALIVAVLVATYRPFGRRWSFELALFGAFLNAAMLMALNLFQRGRLEAGFTASMLLVFLGSSTLLHMPSRKVVTMLTLTTLSYGVVAIVSRVSTPLAIVSQLMIFGSGILIAGIGVRFSYRLMRSEFYTRRRLQTANLRLAKLEQQRTD